MAESTISKTFRNGKVKKRDGGGPPLEFEFSYEDGDFAFGAEQAARTVVYDRGEIVGLRKGNDPVLTASFTVDMRQFASVALADNPIDVLEHTGSWAAAISTGGSNFEFPVGTYIFTVQGVAYGEAADHVLTCAKAFATWDFKEGDRDKITVKLLLEGFDDIPHDCVCRLQIGATVEAADATVTELTNADLRQYTRSFTFQLPAPVTTFTILIEGATNAPTTTFHVAERIFWALP